MLGLIRFILSLIVVKGHVWPTSFSWTAWQSVFAFYTLSGYLMTLVLHEVYGFNYNGIKAFLLNRALRLAPAYYITIIFAALVSFFLFPLTVLNGSLKIPTDFYSILANITIIGLVSFDNSSLVLSRLSPSAWSLSVELFCYILLALGFAKTPKKLIYLLIIGILLLIISYFVARYRLIDKNWNYGQFKFYNLYCVLHAGFVPFSLGGLSYFYRQQIIMFFRKKLIFLSLYLGCLLLISSYSHFMQFVLGYFLMSAFFAAIVPIMIEKRIPNFYKQIDKLLGDLAYPIFISHWVIASIIFSCLPMQKNSFLLFITTILGATLFSLPILWLERRINIYRSNLKKKARIETEICDLELKPK